jgi:hypothetical protein
MRKKQLNNHLEYLLAKALPGFIYCSPLKNRATHYLTRLFATPHLPHPICHALFAMPYLPRPSGRGPKKQITGL